MGYKEFFFLFIIRVVKHWKRLARGVVDALSREPVKVRL